MARIRTIKPDFWTDETLTECSLITRLLFIGMWNFADDHGGIEASAKQLKMKIFPCDNVKIEPMLKELIAHGLLMEYSVNNRNYLHIKGFRTHQVINRPSKPRCPKYEDSLSIHGAISEDSKREEEEEEEEKILSDEPDFSSQADDCFEKLWGRYPRKDGKKEALRHFKATVKSFDDARSCWFALTKYLDHIDGCDPKFIKTGKVWFNNWQDWIPTEDENAAA